MARWVANFMEYDINLKEAGYPDKNQDAVARQINQDLFPFIGRKE